MAKKSETEVKVKDEIIEESEPKKEKKKKSSNDDERAPIAPKAKRKRGGREEPSDEESPEKKTTTTKAKLKDKDGASESVSRARGSRSRSKSRSRSRSPPTSPRRQSKTSANSPSPVIKRGSSGAMAPKRLKLLNSTTKRPISTESPPTNKGGGGGDARSRSGGSAGPPQRRNRDERSRSRSGSAARARSSKPRNHPDARELSRSRSPRSGARGGNNNNNNKKRLLSPESRSRSRGRSPGGADGPKQGRMRNLLSPDPKRRDDGSVDSAGRMRRQRSRSPSGRPQRPRSPNGRERSLSPRKPLPRRSGSRSRDRSWRNRSRGKSFSRRRRSRSRSLPHRFRSRSRRSRRNNNQRGKPAVSGVNAMPLGGGPSYRDKDSRSRSRRTRRSQSPDRIRLWVMNNDCARIIGKNGNAMKDIEDECNVGLTVQKEKEMRQLGVQERYVDIRGKRQEDRERAKERIMELADFVKDSEGFVLKGDVEDALKLRVLSDEVVRILGRRGQMIKDIEHYSGARIEVIRRRGIIEIHGTVEEKDRATDKILEEVSWCKTIDGKILKDEPPAPLDDDCLKMYVLDKEAGRVIGRGGETVREIMDKSNAEVKVQKNEGFDVVANERLIQIYGEKAEREKAMELILKEVTFAKDKLGEIIKNTGNHTVPPGIEVVKQKGVNKGAWICGFCSGDHKTKLCPSTQMNAQALAQMQLLAGMGPVMPVLPPGIPATMLPPIIPAIPAPGMRILAPVPRPSMGMGGPRRTPYGNDGPLFPPPPPPPAANLYHDSTSPLMPPHIPASAPEDDSDKENDNKSVASSSSGKSRRTVENEKVESPEEKNKGSDGAANKDEDSEAIDEDDL